MVGTDLSVSFDIMHVLRSLFSLFICNNNINMRPTPKMSLGIMFKKKGFLQMHQQRSVDSRHDLTDARNARYTGTVKYDKLLIEWH